jgi:hypothetical protein
VAQADRLAGGDQAIVDVGRLLGGDVQLVAELAQVGDAHAQRAREADVDLRAVRNGKASFERSAVVTDCMSSRERGPWTLICA